MPVPNYFLQSALAPLGLTGLEVTKPKQTETVQRWKIGLIVGESRLPAKLEFSRRQQRIACDVGMPDRDVLYYYRQSPFATQYYGAISMAGQKILALASAGRSVARDLFDLHHLLVFLKTDLRRATAGLETDLLRIACAKIAKFSYDDFAEEVLPYLTAELIAWYSNHATFETMQGEALACVKGVMP